MSWAYMYVMGFIFIAFTHKYNRQLLRIQWKDLGKWALFLLGVGVLRFLIITYLLKGTGLVPDLSAIAFIPWYFMVLAGFEEAMFTLPMYYIAKCTENRYIKYLLMFSLAAVFASGHIYQGLFALVPTFIYMFYIAPKYMKKLGFGTMVLAHIMYDLTVWGLVQILTNPSLLNYSLHSCQVP